LPLLGVSCARAELPRREADQALEVLAELALVPEAGARGDFRQGQLAAALQELLGPLDAAGEDVLVRRQAGGPLEPPGEVTGAEAGDRRQLLQSRVGVEVFLEVLDDAAETPPWKRAVPSTRWLPGAKTCRVRWTAR
jgi:hypothetical protein